MLLAEAFYKAGIVTREQADKAQREIINRRLWDKQKDDNKKEEKPSAN